MFVEPDEITASRDRCFSRYGEVAHLGLGDTRCTVSINARTTQDGHPVGLIGDLHLGEPQTATEVLGFARAWLRERGARIVRGPITRHTWYPFRAVVDGFAAPPPLSGEPWNQPDLVPRLREHAFEPVAWYVSTWTRDSSDQIERSADKVARLERSGYTLRRFDTDRALDELRLVHEVTLRSFAPPFNYMFVPIDFEEFLAVLGPAGSAIDPDLFLICEAPDGTPAGYCYTTVEGEDLASIKTLVVCPEHRSSGAGGAFVAVTHARCRERGLSRVAHALMRKGGPSIAISDRGGHEIFRRYLVVEGAL